MIPAAMSFARKISTIRVLASFFRQTPIAAIQIDIQAWLFLEDPKL